MSEKRTERKQYGDDVGLVVEYEIDTHSVNFKAREFRRWSRPSTGESGIQHDKQVNGWDLKR